MVTIETTSELTANVYDEDGKQINHIKGLFIQMTAGEPHKVLIEVSNPKMTIKNIQDDYDINLEDYTSRYLKLLRDAINKELELRQ